MKKNPQQNPSGFAAKIDSSDQCRPVGPGEFDPVIEVLLQDAAELTAKLDPMVREQFKGDPETLAEWDKIMQEFYEKYPEHRPIEH